MMFRLVSLALCILVCNAASLPVGQQSDSSAAAAPRTDDVYCEINGQKVKPGQRQKQNSFVYECQLSDTYLGVKIVACLDDQGTEHQFGDRWPHGQAPFRFVLECAKTNGITTRSVVQCFYDGPDGQAKIEPDSEQRVGNKVLRCKKRQGNGLEYGVQYDAASPVPIGTNAGTVSGGSASASTSTGGGSGSTVVNNDSVAKAGSSSVSTTNTNKEPTCIFNGQEMKIGQRSTSSSFVYECQRTEVSARAVIVACLDGNTPKAEHAVGQRWTETQEKPFGFVFECVKNGDVTSTRAVQCDYNSDEGRAQLEPGQEQTVGKYVVQCNRKGDNGVQYHIEFTKAYLASVSAVSTVVKPTTQ